MNYFDILLAKKLEDDRDPKVEGLSVSENGRYHEDGVVYDPVIVALPLDYKTITQNGTYLASDDNLEGYDEVEVNVPLPANAYLLKSVSGLPQPIATFSDGSNLPMPKLEVGIEPVQEGSGDPSPTNIRPISGWDEVNVYDTGVNIWDEDWEAGLLSATTGQPITGTGVRSKNFIKCLSATNYYICCPTGSYLMWYDENKNFISSSSFTQSGVITTPSNAKFFKVRIDGSNTYGNNFSVNYPSTDTSYHAYNGQIYTIDLNGTRYGGKVDLVSGVMTVDRAYVDLGTLNWLYSSGTQRMYSTGIQSSVKAPPSSSDEANIMCSIYATDTDAHTASHFADATIAVGENKILYVYDTRFSDAEAFKTAMNGVQLVYELATPITYQLTPTQVKSLLGSNNVWADSGDVLDGKYFSKEE